VSAPAPARTTTGVAVGADAVARLQRRTVSLLDVTQVLGGVGVAVGIAVGALLAADMGGPGVSGLATSASVVGGALLVVPATRLMRHGGRRPGLVFAYVCGAIGAVVVVAGAASEQLALVLAGMALFGGGTTANLQARYAAVDLAAPERRGRELSIVVWATTVGAVAGPNLAPLAEEAVAGWELRTYAGPYVFSAVAFAVAAAVLTVLLRPDPLRTARELDAAEAGAAPDGAAAGTTAPGSGVRQGWRTVTASPTARLAVVAVATGHLVMVGVMSMTPVHVGAGSHDHEAVLRIVGIVLSAHIAGMYALSPVTGWLTDRLGRRPVILAGAGILAAACAVAGTAGQDTGRLTAGLTLLGLGWSATLVAGSTLLADAVDVAARPAAQGLSDLLMGVAGAASAAVSGGIVALGGYGTLTVVAAVAVVPLVVLALRPPRAGPEPDVVPAVG
jgi:MFS family permease